jgi:AraC-like DNA-binding protein
MTLDVTPVRYRPHDDDYRFEVEVIGATVLRSRVASDPRRGFERVDFPAVLFVRSGTYTHTVDFETHECSAGSCLVIAPGQVHRFGPPSEWDGWILVVGSPHVSDIVDRLPTHVRTEGVLTDAVVELFERMAADVASPADRVLVGELLALQARVLAGRLALGDRGADAGPGAEPLLRERFREYRAEVDRQFRRWHQVAPYARHLGYSAKSLNRACRAGGGMTAKRVIVERIVLEARRLLAHGTATVATISADLGFDEPTNFVKFFRRETGVTPAAFRATARRT